MGRNLKFNEGRGTAFPGDAMTIRETITEIIRRRERNIFLLDADSGAEITYGEFHRMACAVAAELSRRGLRKGDRVAVMLPNCCELAVFYFACIYLGAVVVPINPALAKGDVGFILENCKPKMLVTSESCTARVGNLHANVIRLSTAQDTDAIKPAAVSGIIRIHQLENRPQFVPLENANAEDLIAIMYTSGTSAKPKGLAHRLGSMLRNARAFADAQHIDQDSRFYLTLSMAYMGGLYNLLILPLLCGSSVVVDRVFDARSSLSFWDKAKNYHVNALWMAPTVLSILLRMDRGQTGEEFCRASVRHTFVGFAPLPLKVKAEFEARYGIRLIENYGLSETLFVSARSLAGVGGQGYVGDALPGVAVRILNEDHQSVPAGFDGEVQILTPDLMAGYLDADGGLTPIDASKWFATGDVGCLDTNGSLSITGRKKDLIIRGGVNISPAAIEESLAQVQGVAEVAVVSIPHELYGEDIVAVLKLHQGVELESMLDSLIAHAKRNLAQHQQPARYITIDEFPRTANGKVQKSRIRELIAEKLQISALTPVHTRTEIEETVGVSR
ncbi:MAG: class I adenylate-forming enzyme family protein [Candidatus Sulfotelmatobacter sp.]